MLRGMTEDINLAFGEFFLDGTVSEDESIPVQPIGHEVKPLQIERLAPAVMVAKNEPLVPFQFGQKFGHPVLGTEGEVTDNDDPIIWLDNPVPVPNDGIVHVVHVYEGT